MTRPRGCLVLEGTAGSSDSLVFEGTLFGAVPESAQAWDSAYREDKGYGEVVFNTSMTGYQEILTDPSYFGQMVCMTTAHIGNTGVNPEDVESRKPWAAGFIIRELCDTASNWRANQELDAYLKAAGIPGLADVDTRALTRCLRTRGVVRGVIVPHTDIAKARACLAALPAFEGRDMIREVSTRTAYTWPEKPARSAKRKVVVLDFGVKWNLLRSLEERGCALEVLPATATAEDVLARKPDGVFLSNGPGDPSAAPYAVTTVKSLLGRVPIFGVCMGHQILSLALGGRTYKMKFGHRGGNQPVFDQARGVVEISSHNHGYTVDAASLPRDVAVTHLNLNDKTVEGLAVPSKSAFSVQYHPEACPGPHDSVVHFDRFMDMMNR